LAQLEHLESVFCKQALSTIPLSAFTTAGFSTAFCDRLKFNAHDEDAHVLYFEAGLAAAMLSL
jgi:hypothetical protein